VCFFVKSSFNQITINNMSNQAIDVVNSSTNPVNTTLATGLNKTDDTITTHEKAGTPISLSASGQILAAPGRIIGFYVNSTTSGTIRFSDALTATTPYLGAAITPAVGYHTYPAALGTGGYATIGGTALDVTVFVVAN
jgi:hypothetical protein